MQWFSRNKDWNVCGRFCKFVRGIGKWEVGNHIAWILRATEGARPTSLYFGLLAWAGGMAWDGVEKRPSNPNTRRLQW